MSCSIINSKKIGVFVPTYRRADVIEDLLEQICDVFYNYDIDITICDSSDDDKTEGVVKKYTKAYDNVYYLRLDPSIHSNSKVYLIYKTYDFQIRYSYIWIMSDRIRPTEYLLEMIHSYLSNYYDLIVIGRKKMEGGADKEYSDYDSLLSEVAWEMTSYGSTIVNSRSMLYDADWMMLEDKYLVDRKVNHSHVALYFEQLYKKESFRVLRIDFRAGFYSRSKMKIESGWLRDTFPIWVDYWQETIFSLPGDNSAKKVAIRSHGVNSGLFSNDRLIVLRKKKILNLSVSLRYFIRWRYLSDVPRWLFLLISIWPAKKLMYLPIDTAKIENKRLRCIRNLYIHFPKIYIYGHGRIAEKYTEYLDYLNIPCNGYIVSKLSHDDYLQTEHMIIEYDEEIVRDKRVGIIMGMNRKNTVAVMESMALWRYGDRIFNEDIDSLDFITRSE